MTGDEARGKVVEGESLQGLWHLKVREDPDAPAMGFYTRRDEFNWLSRADLHDTANAYRALLEESGLDRGEVCLIVMPSGEVAASVLLGALLLGAIPLLVAPPTFHGTNSHLADTVRSCAERTGAPVAVCMDEGSGPPIDQGALGATRVLSVGKEPLPRQSGGPAPVLPSGDEVAAMQLTSGTTGLPRICSWRQRGVLAALDGMEAAMALSSDDVCFNWTPLYHDMGLVNNMLLCLTRGVALAMLDPHDFVRDPALWLRGLARTRATVTWSPNFGFAVAAERVSDEDLGDVRLDGVRAFWNAAERIHLSTLQAFHARFARFGVAMDALKTNFGCAENVGGATFSAPQGAFVSEWLDRELLYDEWTAVPLAEGSDRSDGVPIVGVGRPYPGMEIVILSEEGEPLPDGEVGEIALRTPSRMLGYVGDEEATSRALHGDLLRTGDLGYMRGPELFWVGRVRERITVRGKKIDPSDFEPILFEIDGLRPGCFVAFGVDDPARGTQRAVVVSEVREPLGREPDEIMGDVRRAAFDTLGMSLDDVLLVPAGTLTKTSSGKRRHRHFRSMYVNGDLQTMTVPNSTADVI